MACRCPGWSSGPGRSRPTSSRPTGAHFTCVDGHDYIDLCLGDTGAMAGHGPAPTIAAVERQLRRGITHMLPTEDAAWVGEELTRRFGVGSWQFALSATRCQPLGPPPRPPRHGAPQGRRPRPLLPRLGRRGDRDARRRRLGRAGPRLGRAAGRRRARRPASSSSTTSTGSRPPSPTATSRRSCSSRR